MRAPRKQRIASLLLGLLWLWVGAAHSEAAQADETFFELKIRPVLAGSCVHCHGASQASQNLRVDSRAALLKGGNSGPAILPGEPEKGSLLRFLRQTHPTNEPAHKKELSAGTLSDFE